MGACARRSCTHPTRGAEHQPVSTRVTPRRRPGRGVFSWSHHRHDRKPTDMGEQDTQPSRARRAWSGRWRRPVPPTSSASPGGAILPAYDPLMDSTDPPHPGPPRAGRRATPPRGTPPPPAGWACAWPPPGPGATNLVTPARRRPHGLGADRGHHRPGRRRVDRHRRLPGGRHPRHHDADHQAQLPGHRPRRDPAHDRRGVLHRLDRPSRARCWSTWPSPPCRRGPRSTGRAELLAARLPARSPARTPSRSARPPG